MNEKYNYNLHGSGRKPLVEAISQILDRPAVYQGAPSFSYIIGDYTVDRNGTLSYGSNIHPDFAAVLVSDLRERGFIAERVAIDGIAEASAVDENVHDAGSDTDAPGKLTVEIPDTGFTPTSRENLKKIVASKATLLKQALGTDELPIIEIDGKVSFPWFTLHNIDGETDAYNRLITAICNMAKRQKRVTATDRPEENAKYGMRLFLIRLGFIGDEYKTARKILLRDLSGNGSWKSGHRPECSAEAMTPPDPAGAAAPTRQELTSPLEELDTKGDSPQKEAEGGEAYGK